MLYFYTYLYFLFWITLKAISLYSYQTILFLLPLYNFSLFHQINFFCQYNNVACTPGLHRHSLRKSKIFRFLRLVYLEMKKIIKFVNKQEIEKRYIFNEIGFFHIPMPENRKIKDYSKIEYQYQRHPLLKYQKREKQVEIWRGKIIKE